MNNLSPAVEEQAEMTPKCTDRHNSNTGPEAQNKLKNDYKIHPNSPSQEATAQEHGWMHQELKINFHQTLQRESLKMLKYANMPQVQGVSRFESFPINGSLFVFGYKNPSFDDRKLEVGEQNTSHKFLSCFFQSPLGFMQLIPKSSISTHLKVLLSKFCYKADERLLDARFDFLFNGNQNNRSIICYGTIA